MRHVVFDLDVLRSFVLGIELGSFAKAAQRLGRSTSAVSAQLKKLEDQVDVSILRKSGRGMVLTATGETLFAYAKRLLELNDEAALAVQGVELAGCVRLGLQEDFGERFLSETLGRFSRAHPRIRIEVRIARNAELLDLVCSGGLDLALAWDSGRHTPNSHFITKLPMCWVGHGKVDYCLKGEPVPLAVLESPCQMRSAATNALDLAGIPWRLALTSPSLAGIWAGVSADLGISVRTKTALPPHLMVLEGLPALPHIGLSLHRAKTDSVPAVAHLAEIILAAVNNLLSQH